MSTPPLNYAANSPRHHYKWLKHLTGVLVFLFVVSFAWWVPSALRHAELLYWQNACLAYLPPPDQLVYDRAQSIQLVPRQWSNFYAVFSPPGFVAQATVFLHELKTPAGESRLVIVDFVPKPDGTLLQHTRVFMPGSAGELPREIIQQSGVPPLQFPQENTRLFAGHVDPVNTSHFTFRVQQGKSQTLYDGWLQNDNTVVIGEEKLRPL